ncbi:MAG TPA: DUF1990 family protein [Lacunisphaera sp.]|nr:DUF1990 family protein [Lacunisphaera sp.]
MKTFLRDHSRRLAAYLPEFCARDVERHGGPVIAESVRLRAAPAGPPLDETDLGFLFAYRVFPPEILRSRAEWEEENRSMRVGDTIVQQVEFPPGHGLHFVFGVRVTAVFREPACAGFRYRALAGHPEHGENEFRFERRDDGIFALVRTEAGFASWLLRLLAPVCAAPYVRYCNLSAARVMCDQFRRRNDARLAAPRRNE